MPQTIDSSSINPVHAQVKSTFNRCNRLLIILIPPTEGPGPTTHSPGPHANRRNLHIGLTKLSCMHRYQHPSFNALSLDLLGFQAVYLLSKGDKRQAFSRPA